MGHLSQARFRIKDRVELREPVDGRPAGASGTVASTSADGRLLIRFDGVAHAVAVDCDLLRPAGGRHDG
jgi:hypothetical protein